MTERTERAAALPLRTAADAGDYLDSLINRERIPERARGRVGLGPIRALLEAADHPEAGLSIIHVAGSKGKGSVCLFAEALLRSLGGRTGTFTSPHLESWTERFRIDGEPVEGASLARVVERLRPHVERMRRDQPNDAPSFFDATTAAAMLLFAEAGVDTVLLEVGLGGRLDSTNAVTPAVACITSIELEHTQILGDTVEAIAHEKAGILKPGAPAVVGALVPEALAVVRSRAEEIRAPLRVEGEHFGSHFVRRGRAAADERNPCGGELRYSDRFAGAPFELEVELDLLGAHHAVNAGLALACVRSLASHAPDAIAAAACRAFPGVVLPGRVELVSRAPWVVVDSAHTAASARALAAALADLPCSGRHLVLSVSEGKDLDAVIAALAPQSTRISVTRADAQRSLAPADVAAAVRAAAPSADLRVVPNPHLAVRAARESLGNDELLCVAGSVYLAGIARAVLRGDLARALVSRRSVVEPRGPGA